MEQVALFGDVFIVTVQMFVVYLLLLGIGFWDGGSEEDMPNYPCNI